MANTYFPLKVREPGLHASLYRDTGKYLLCLLDFFLVLVPWKVDWRNGEIKSAHMEFPLVVLSRKSHGVLNGSDEELSTCAHPRWKPSGFHDDVCC